MDKGINLIDFSAYRSVLMGVAIIFIMASHTLWGYAAYGIIGVEWFLVLSAIGQYYSLKKDSDLKGYFKRRLLRILPAYLIVAIPFFIVKNPASVKVFLIRISGLNLALWGERFFWFVSLIFLCYLMAPLYFRIINTFKFSFILPFILAGITFILSFYLPKTEILLTRIPVFLLGMSFAKYVYEGTFIEKENSINIILISSVISVLLLLTIYIDWIGIELVRVIYFICAIPTLFFVLSVAKSVTPIQPPLAWIGAISYELYLVHQHIALALCAKLPFPRAINVICSYALAFVLAYILHILVSKLTPLPKSDINNK